MKIGHGCTVHLHAEELPSGRLIVRLSRHMCAVIDGVIHDTHDPSRQGTRCVYGYWQHPTTGASRVSPARGPRPPDFRTLRVRGTGNGPHPVSPTREGNS
ncbi:MAG: hypothetical protein ABSH36_06960, partial [Solirubrobacteraceae bacterium]